MLKRQTIPAHPWFANNALHFTNLRFPSVMRTIAHGGSIQPERERVFVPFPLPRCCLQAQLVAIFGIGPSTVALFLLAALRHTLFWRIRYPTISVKCHIIIVPKSSIITLH